ncbi:hypothetical protein JNW90_29385 [Micromonospora sp. STR1s_5]|nr:hypothetical protein [Micromonospora sp. STR1s_5]
MPVARGKRSPVLGNPTSARVEVTYEDRTYVWVLTHQDDVPLVAEVTTERDTEQDPVTQETLPGAVLRGHLVLTGRVTHTGLVNRAGDRVTNGDEPGALITCGQCNGDAVLFVPDIPPAPGPAPQQDL